jgi:hypothetical protein
MVGPSECRAGRVGEKVAAWERSGKGAGLLARVVRFVVSIVVLIIVAGILLVVLKANPANSIVSEVHSWARWLAGPFDGMFSSIAPTTLSLSTGASPRSSTCSWAY